MRVPNYISPSRRIVEAYACPGNWCGLATFVPTEVRPRNF
ncbi:hypothetical protein vBPaerPsIn_99c [Pseudomonas phage vB_Paer_PsIn]|uniref:Uncharacterized protein n=1 Tax=Pseudomonas phage vB_Paer_PsIn TaxID=2924907 RepID=A0AAE9KG45_9CAUD|nr:hypothetical protein QE348_gp099 [Pseudomonas phage vB_Paer_PsIn]UOL48127.1 hypothetical protein vBPaerPsIn_99c [Pseudomonas phage vB_Paer_PsIn]